MGALRTGEELREAVRREVALTSARDVARRAKVGHTVVAGYVRADAQRLRLGDRHALRLYEVLT